MKLGAEEEREVGVGEVGVRVGKEAERHQLKS